MGADTGKLLGVGRAGAIRHSTGRSCFSSSLNNLQNEEWNISTPIDMDITNLSPAQRAELLAQLEAQERAEKQKREDEVNAYKGSVDDFVRRALAMLMPLSKKLNEVKNILFKEKDAIVDIKEALYDTKLDRHSNTFTTSDGKITLSMGYRTVDGWSDDAEAGIAKIKDYMKSLAKDENGAKQNKIIMELLAKDKKGNLKLSSIVQLEKHANEFGDPLFIEGVRIIKDSYRPQETSQFISISYRDENGVKHTLPLSLSKMDIEKGGQDE